MITKSLLPTTRYAARNSLICVCLWLLAAGLPPAVLGQANYATPYTFTTLAGNAGYGSSADGTGSAAQFWSPDAVAVDRAGNVYVAENQTIRKVTTGGVVATLAGLAGSFGGADGTGSAGRFNSPQGVAVDSAGNVYVADTQNNTIRKVTPMGVVTTLAGLAGTPGTDDGTGGAARFNWPQGVAVDNAGNVYVADGNNDTIRKVTPAGVVTTLAGLAGAAGADDGTRRAARFNFPSGMAVDNTGNIVVADYGNGTIRKVTSEGVVTTLAGLAGSFGSLDGTGNAARFGGGPFQGSYVGPVGVAVDISGNVYVADYWNDTIRKVSPEGVVTTLAGLARNRGADDGTGSAASFNQPGGVAVDSTGNVYVADQGNNTIRKVTQGGAVTTLAGLAGGSGTDDGTGSAARFNEPFGVAADSGGNVYVADSGNSTVRKVTPMGVVTTLAGLAGGSGNNDGTGSAARFSRPLGVATDTGGNIYVADTWNDTIRKVTPGGEVTTLAGLAGNSGTNDGTGSAARFNQPFGVAVDSAGNVYVADTYNTTIRKVTPAGVVTTLAGLAGSSGSADGTNNDARFNGPTGVAVDGAGNVYAADSGNNTIRKVTPVGTNWVVTTLAGRANGCLWCLPSADYADGASSDARFNNPTGVAVDSAGSVYVGDAGNSVIRKVAGGDVTTLAGRYPAGQDMGGSADGTGSAARFSPGGYAGLVKVGASGVAVDSAGNVYVADTLNCTIRKGIPASSVPAPALQSPSLGTGQVGFGITGLPGLAVDIESSAGFSQWQLVGTYILEGGTNYFVNPYPPQDTQFYRGHVR